MNRPGFTFIINASLTESLLEGVERFYQVHGKLFSARLFSTHDIEEEAISPDAVRSALISASMVFLDIRGGGKALGVAAGALAQTKTPVALLVGGSPECMSLVRLGSFSMRQAMARAGKKGKGSRPGKSFNLRSARRMMDWIEKGGTLFPFGKLRHARNWARMMRYWQHGGGENIKNMLAFAGREYAGFKIAKPPVPREYPDCGIYDPLSGFTHDDLDAYVASIDWNPDLPTVGLLFYGGMHFSQSVVPARALAQWLRSHQMANIVPVFSTATDNMQAIRKYFFDHQTPFVDAVVYLQWFSLNTFTDAAPDQAVALLKELGVPVFSGVPMFGREIDAWRESVQGLSPIEVLTTVILPETDGMIEPLPSCGLVEQSHPEIEGAVKKVVPIQGRIAHMAGRIGKWTALSRKRNSEKRVAFIVYDNPPGEDNLGNAAYIDTFASLKKLFGIMAERGYSVSGVPEKQGLHEYFLSRQLVNLARWGDVRESFKHGRMVSVNQYQGLLETLPAGDEIAPQWGPPPGEIMCEDDRLLIPAVEFGNLLVGLQPARGYHADPDKISHDKTLPPHHQYVAFYRWLEEHWRPDCVVHVGTHGTLEFLKGKETGMSGRCFPSSLLGNVPHLYFYHVVNASEATIAKRRSLGVLVNYNSPAFTAGGLYDEYESLDQLIAETIEARTLEPARAERLSERVMQKAAQLNFACETVESVQEEISMMKRAIIPKGLHLLGEGIDANGQLDFATFFLRYDRGRTPSLHRRLCEAQGLSYEDLLRPGKAGNAVDPRALEKIDANVRTIVEAACKDDCLPGTEPERSAVLQAITAAKNLGGDLEIENFLAGLSGKYIAPGLGGDPLRTPEVLPTGRNSYQFDPRLVPSEEACRRGWEIADNTLAHYYALNGAYPDSTAVILWGFETTKTRGETVGQILAYLGVRVRHDSNPYYKKLEAVPLEELGRPRVDCMVQICGFFRDMFPTVLSMINRAVDLVAELDESEDKNFVRKNTRAMKARLEGSVAPEQLDRIARGRVFGPRPGEYGTRTTGLIETGAWTSETEISDLFTATMSHLYADNLHGQRCLDAYRHRLASVDLVSQVRDTHEYEIMDLDHYYEFFGGLSRTVESVKGRAPAMLITDTTKEILLTETVGESLNRGIRSRLLNPRWIDGLLAHDYHGAQKISDRVEYLIGFAATTHAVENWIWSKVTERYIADSEMFARMCANNRFAVESMIKRLLEAEKRDYWNPTETEKQLLMDRYMELEGMIEERMEP
ncbi:magnesium chelatase subunit H [Desulfosarcina ovata]|uniref:Magnesium chelatase subunit H n=1 Tax=Desulfosarcina ovata subsp. ovata TaxID=2752305 RepID=A0A5K8AB16_9BACT|nr:magnesium chelatase subunit H [Desulfosarcina ovata]BBO89140.1 magnesium chelatase subunit H [Desulfosarcina ovata subsp. ovata]